MMRVIYEKFLNGRTLVTTMATLLCCLLSVSAHAACSDPAAEAGEIIYNADQNVPQVCSGTVWIALGQLNPGAGGSGCTNPTGIEGQIIYNGDIFMPQYCDGDDWKEMITVVGGIDLGQPCEGGYFVGRITAGGTVYDMVTQSDDSPSDMTWGPTGTATGATDSVDGPANTTTIVGTAGSHPAAEYCDALTEGGYTDWYLPAQDEFLFAGFAAPIIGNFNIGNSYATSTEQDSNNFRWASPSEDDIPYNTGGQSKTNTVSVRCMRRAAENSCSALGSGGGGGCTAPASCPNVGDVCSDGSLFAGFMVYNNSSCEALYVTNNNQSTSSQWKTATGTNDITDPVAEEDAADGQYNRDNRGSGTFPAFELCENNTYHSKSDWYLPARDELHLLWENRAAINANAAGNFTTGNNWSSTESSTLTAWYQSFSNGDHGNSLTKSSNSTAVRCVRRD